MLYIWTQLVFKELSEVDTKLRVQVRGGLRIWTQATGSVAYALDGHATGPLLRFEWVGHMCMWADCTSWVSLHSSSKRASKEDFLSLGYKNTNLSFFFSPARSFTLDLSCCLFCKQNRKSSQVCSSRIPIKARKIAQEAAYGFEEQEDPSVPKYVSSSLDCVWNAPSWS